MVFYYKNFFLAELHIYPERDKRKPIAKITNFVLFVV